MGQQFELREEITTGASPEQAWEAVATGQGLNSWFMGRNEVEPGEGGRVRLVLGDFAVGGTVTAWEPPRRFAYQGDAGPDGRSMTVEYQLTESASGGTLVRSITTSPLGEDAEAEYEALRKGGAMYLHTLGEYLEHFPGRTATPIWAALPPVDTGTDTWAELLQALGVTGPIVVGDRVRLTPAGLHPIEGVVDYATADFLGVRTDDALYRFIHGYAHTLALTHHLFAPEVTAGEMERRWQAWLNRLAG